MSIDFAKLASQGRAYSSGRAWEAEELEAVVMFERERGFSRIKAADYVRNGILTLEAFDKAIKKEFTPMTQDEAVQKAEESLKKRGEEFSEADAPSEVKPKRTRRSKTQ